MKRLWRNRSRATYQILVGWFVIAEVLCGCRSSSKNSAASSLPAIEAQSKWPYDRELIAAIQKRWYDLIARRPTPRGKVVVVFNLRANGTVDDIKVTDSDVGTLYEVFCQRAITDVAPFRPWPRKMKDELKSDVRAVRFTFTYN